MIDEGKPILMRDMFKLAVREQWNTCSVQYRQEVSNIWFNNLDAKVGHMDVREVGLREVQLCKHRSTNFPIAVLSVLFRLAEQYGYRPVGTNPCQAIKRHRTVHRDRYGSPEELARLGEALQKYKRTHLPEVVFVYTVLYTGARPSEIARATPDQVKNGVLHWSKGKNGDSRNIQLPKQVLDMLAELPTPRSTLTGCRGANAFWAKLCKEAGIEGLWLRDLRRTFASIALNSGESLDIVAEILGHRSTQTTKIYAKLFSKKAAESVNNTAANMEKMLSF